MDSLLVAGLALLLFIAGINLNLNGVDGVVVVELRAVDRLEVPIDLFVNQFDTPNITLFDLYCNLIIFDCNVIILLILGSCMIFILIEY